MTDRLPLLFRGARILSMDPAVGDLDRGDILVDGSTISAIGPDLDVAGPVETIPADGCIVIPGFVDTHRHMWEGALRGYAPGATLGEYFGHTLGVVGPALRPDEVHTGELLSALSALEAGITTVQDISNIQASPVHTDAVVDALVESGLRAVFCYGKTLPQMLAAGTALPGDEVRRVRSQLLPDARGLVTLALDTEPGGDEQAELNNFRLADELDVLTARHCSDEYPVLRLQKLGALRPRTTFIHGNGLDAGELAAIADAGGSLSVAPAIELQMGHGYPWLGPAVRAGVPVSLSTDIEVVVASDMFTQMRAAYQSARYRQLADSDVAVSVRDILRFATLGGAQSLGLAERTGTLTPGKQADLVVLRADRPDVVPVYDPYSTVVLQMDRSHVDTVLVAGVAVKRAGRLVTDTATVIERARRTAERLASAGLIGPA